MIDRDLLFLRNVVHGAPVPKLRIAARLRAIDVRFNELLAPDRRIPIRDVEYYVEIAERIERTR